MNYLTLSFLILFLPQALTAQLHERRTDIRYETITVEQGLSQSSVWCSMQDREGFLWFGTADGLNRYDGYTFRVFRHDESDSTSLSNNTVWSLLEDHAGRIWVGTISGIDLYNRESGTFTHLAREERYRNTLLTQYTRSMLEDRSGKIWLGTINGIVVLDPETGHLLQFPHESQDTAAATQPLSLLHEDDDGNIWHSWRGALFQHVRATGKTVRVPLERGYESVAIVKSIRDRTGVYWFATTSKGAFSFNPHTKEWRSFTSDPRNRSSINDVGFRALCEDNNGNIWFGGITQGACYLDESTGRFYSFRPDDPKSRNARYEGVASILRDRSGLIWIGYDGAGLVKVNPYKNKFPHILLPPSGLTATGDNFFKALMVDHQGDVWLGTYDQGISVLNRTTGRVRRFRHSDSDPKSLCSNSVFALLEDRDQNIWIGTLRGLDVYDPIKGTFSHQEIPGLKSGRDRIVTALSRDSVGAIWCGTATSVFKFEPGGQPQARMVLSTQDLLDLPIPPGVNVIYPMTDGTAWIGTLGGGLIKLRSDLSVERIFRRTSEKAGTISHNSVKTIAVDRSGVLWIGTEGGLNRYDPIKDQWRAYTTRDGLPNDFIYGLLLDDQQKLWVSTNRGLACVNVRDPAHLKIRSYSPDDGLQSYEFNTNVYFKTPEGEMFFGGVNGFNAFFPDSIKDNPVIPPVVLTGFKKFDQAFALDGDISTIKEIRLPYTESVFSFEFAALEYTDPKRNKYAYWMEGFGKGWNYLGNHREARYTNLDPGTYTFRVKASNDDGVWNETGTAISVIIVPPFWRTWWFIALVALTGIGTFGGTVRFISVQKLKKRIQELEREKAIQDERQKTRERIARDLHDDLASTVGSAGFFVESVKHRMTDAPSEAREFLDKTSSLLTEAEQAMSDIVWSVSPRHDTLESLLLRIRLTTADICKASGMKYEVDINRGDSSTNLHQDIRRNIYLVFKEAITNAARHSGGALVKVSAKASDGLFELIVCDDGKGLTPQPASPTRRGHGLRNMKQRAEEIGAEFTIDSCEGKGTTIRLLKRMT